jgi:two-component system sensor histidine kinase KdpD
VDGSSVLKAFHRFGYAVAIVAVLVSTVAFVPMRESLGFSHIAWFYLVLVGVIAWACGTGPAVLTAVLSFFTGNFFLTPPYGTFRVGDPRDLILLFVFLAGAMTVGALTGRLREREMSAVRNEREATALARLAAEMAAGADTETVVERAVSSLMTLPRVESVAAWLAGDDGRLEARGPGARFVAERDHELAQRVMTQVKALGLPDVAHDEDRLGSGWPARDLQVEDSCCGVLVPLVSATGVEGVLQVLPDARGLSPHETSILVSVSHLLAVFLAGRGALDLASRMQAAEEAGKVRSAIVSAVSHELKTPLASAMAAVTDLAAEDVVRTPNDVHTRLTQVAEDLSRLESAISDLLDLSRLQADAWLPHPDIYEAGEIIADVTARVAPEVRERLAYHVVEAPVPQVYADFAQIARAVWAILDNAVAYSPPGSAILMGASRGDGMTSLWVEDRGPGVSDADKAFVFDRGFRGEAGHSVPSGTGLGLTIARDLVEANGGRIRAEDAEPTGARFVLDVPAEEPDKGRQ